MGTLGAALTSRLLWAVRTINAIVQLYVIFVVCLPVVVTVVWIIQVTMAGKPIVGVRDAVWRTIPITFLWMAIESFDLVQSQSLSSFSREVLCRQTRCQR